MSAVPLLFGVAVAAVIGGLCLITVGLYGREPTAVPGRRTRGNLRTLASDRTARRWAIAVVAGVAVWAASGWPVAGAATLLAIPGLPHLFSAGKIAAKRIAVLQGLEEWVRRLADAMAAGSAPTQTITASANHAPAAIKPAVQHLAAALASGRADGRAALGRFADEIDDLLGDMVAVALTIAISAPSPKVPDVLRTLAAQLAADVAARRDIETDRAEPRSEARMIVIIQIVFAAVVCLFTSYADSYATAVGQLVLAVIVVVVVAALAMMRRLSTIAAPPRLLATPTTTGTDSRTREQRRGGLANVGAAS